MKHTCHAEGCSVVVPPRLLMCGRHWRMVPRALQREVWREYVPGQEIRKDPTPKYLDVMRRAIEAVAVAEGKIVPTVLGGPAGFQCGELHAMFTEDPAGERPLRCGLPKGHAGPHQDERTVGE